MTRRSMKMALFFSHGVSLKLWKDSGLLDRERVYYEALALQGVLPTFVTYGDASDSSVLDGGRSSAVTNRWRLPARLYQVLSPFLHLRQLRRCDVLKTNQLSAAPSAFLARLLVRRPLMLRCGYSPLLNERIASQTGPKHWLKCKVYGYIARRADVVTVTTERLREHFVQDLSVKPERVVVLRNFIDVGAYAPSERTVVPNRLIYVGRLNREKNLQLVLSAMAELPETELLIIGDGPLAAELQRAAGGANVRFMGRQPADVIPQFLASSQVFILPSQYEGSPKALLEAMASGLAVVGTDVPGIRDTIIHGCTGMLVRPDPHELADCVRTLLRSPQLQRQLGDAARKYVGEFHTVDAVARAELAILWEMVKSE